MGVLSAEGMPAEVKPLFQSAHRFITATDRRLGLQDPVEPGQHQCLQGCLPLGRKNFRPVRLPARFTNAYGVFEYRHLKSEAFFGSQQLAYSTGSLCVARPEKALLDHWHLSPGEWTLERLEAMRYQNGDKVDQARLEECAVRFRRPRLMRVAKRWRQVAQQVDEGTLIL